MPSEFTQRQSYDLVRDISSLGSLFFYVLTMIFFVAIQDYEMLFRLFIGVLIIYAITVIIRAAYFKERPEKFSHHNFLERLDAAAFPSLHAARTGLLAVSFIYYFDNPVLSAIIALLAFGILYSRIHLKRHDFKDVLVGVVLGILAYFTITFIY